jgi:phytoene synthase
MTLPTILSAGLPAEALLGLIDARERELDEEPMADLAELEGHARATAGALQRAIATVTGGDQERASRIGTAYGLIGILRATGHLARRSRILLPSDLLKQHGVRRDAVLAGRDSPELHRVVESVVGAAQARLSGLRARRGEAASPLLMITRHEAKEIRRLNFDPFRAADVGKPAWLALRLLVLQTFGL